MAFTEFYVQTTASNLNAGSTTADAAAFTYAGGTFVRATGVFTVASGNPLTDGVAVGDFASIYTTAGATIATFVARVTARDATTITVSLTAIAGEITTVSEVAGEATLKIGGAWAGPSGAVDFPIGFVAATLTNSSGDNPRVNFKNGVDYSISAVMTADIAGPINWEGYTTTPGDGGRAEFDGGEPAASFILITVSATNNTFRNLIFKRNGSTGTGSAVGFNIASSGSETIVEGCVAHTIRGRGIDLSGADNSILAYCEVYGACIVDNESAIRLNDVSSVMIGCVAHDNVGNTVVGIGVALGAAVIGCISYNNGQNGFQLAQTAGSCLFVKCDSYSNGGSGLDLIGALATMVFVENCNFFGNTLFGIASATQPRNGFIRNCAFGAGSQANGSGDIDSDLSSVYILNKVTYPADQTPWRNPDAGDFTIVHPLSRNAGFGTLTQTQVGQGGTQSFPDIGASQHATEVFSSIN